MHFCDRCRIFADFNAFVKQMCIVLRNNEKCKLCTRNNRFYDVFKSVNCMFFRISNLFRFNLLKKRFDRIMNRIKKQKLVAIVNREKSLKD